MTTSKVRAALIGAALACTATAALDAHITPQVIMRTQADVIRAALPDAAKYEATTIHISRSQFAALENDAHYRPDSDTVRFYSGVDSSGRTLGTVVFPQVDTMHGPLEVGVGIGPDGRVTTVAVTRATVEMKPWVLEVERSGVLEKLKGERAGEQPRELASNTLSGMPGYIANAIATAVYQGLALFSTLRAA